ncbi:MAG: divalent-cation tolerance protein CutA [Sphingobacteriia bacterium]|nr:divalent-cation tolerance protein CutA [Sphingobacteriia bacterium]
MANELVLIYSTAPNIAEARVIAHELVKSRSAACVNIVPNMTSVYYWNNEIQEGNEVILIIKTLRKRFSEVEDIIKDFCSYEVPCIIELTLGEVEKNFAKWLANYS